MRREKKAELEDGRSAERLCLLHTQGSCAHELTAALVNPHKMKSSRSVRSSTNRTRQVINKRKERTQKLGEGCVGAFGVR